MYKNKKIRRVLPWICLAILFYHVHSMEHWTIFNRLPTYETIQEKLHHVAYNLRKSPFFWAAAGGSLFTLLILGLYKKSVYEATKLQLQKKQPKRSALTTYIAQLVTAIDDPQAEELVKTINTLIIRHPYIGLTTLVATNGWTQGILNFLQRPRSFFSICFIFSHIVNNTSQFTQLRSIYSIRHLIAMLDPKDVRYLKEYFQITMDIDEYIIVSKDRQKINEKINSLILNNPQLSAPNSKPRLSHHGLIIMRTLLGMLEAKKSHERGIVDLIAERITRVNELYKIIYYLHANFISIPEELTTIWDNIFTDKWARLQDIDRDIRPYKKAQEILQDFQENNELQHILTQNKWVLNKPEIFTYIVQQLQKNQLQETIIKSIFNKFNNYFIKNDN